MSNPYYDPNQRTSEGAGYPSLQPPQQGNQNVVVGQPVYQGQPPTYVQPYPVQPTVINVNNPMGGGVVGFASFPRCNVCGKNTQTVLTYRSGGMVWIMALIFCLFTGCLCFIPFFIDQWKDKEHRCGVCQNVKGIEQGRLC